MSTDTAQLLQQHEIDTLRIAADKAAMNGQVEAGRILHGLLDATERYEDADAKHEMAEEDWETERDALREALKEARGMLERIQSTARDASDADARERCGEIRLLTSEAIKDIAGALE